MLDDVPAGRFPAAALLLGGLIACGGGDGGSTPTNPTANPPAQNVDACGAIGASSSGLTAITNGATCSAGNASVVSLTMSSATGNSLCSGTIIAPRAVLTAAHCLDGGVTGVLVWRGEHPPEQIPASSFRPHPDYNPGASIMRLDVGIVRVDLDLGRPAMPLVVERDAQQGETAVVAGFGRDLQSVTAGALRAGVTTLRRVEPDFLGTNYSSTTGGICSGDSGGPILLSDGGRWAIAGIISAMSQSVCSTGEHFYARVRSNAIQSFIREHVPEATFR